jgi:hypothetical protein
VPGPEAPRDREAAFPGLAKALWLVLALWMCELLVFAAIRALGVVDGGAAVQAWVLATLLGTASCWPAGCPART